MSTLVGDAYVRLTVNSRGMKNAVRRAGNDAGKFFGGSFEKKLRDENDRILKRMMDDVASAVANVDFSKFEKKFGGVAVAVSEVDHALRKMEKTGYANQKALTQASEALDDWAKRREQEIALDALIVKEQKLAKVRELSSAAQVKFYADEQRQWEKTNDEQVAGFRAYQREQEKQQRLDAAVAAARQKQIQTSGDAQLRYYRELNKAIRTNDREALSSLGVQRNRILALGIKFDEFGDKVDGVGRVVGRVFGKGSRNNFLNFFGSAVTGLFAPLRGVVELFGRLGEGVGTVVQNFKILRNTGSGVVGALGGSLAPLLRTGAAGLAVMGVAAAAAAVALPALVSGVWLLVGALTAMVGAISLGVLGGLLALGPAVLAAVAALGAGVVAFQEINREGSKAGKMLESIKTTWEKSTKGMRDEVEGLADAFRDTLNPLIREFAGPMITGMLGALESVTRHFGTMMQSPEMQGFMKQFTEVLPRIFGDFGRGINNLLGGILALFAAVLPQAESLSGGFESLTQRFLTWSKSGEGQNSIKTWMDTAFTAAESLWNILGNLTSAIGKVFTSGTEGAGQDFLGWLERVTEKFDIWLSSVEGKTAMQTFWQDVRDTMVTVKDIFGEISKALAEMDTEQARADFVTFLGAVQDVASALETVANALTTIRENLSLLTGAGIVGKLIGEGFASAGEGAKGAAARTGDFKAALDASKGSSSALTGTLATGKFQTDVFKGAIDKAAGALDTNRTANSRLQGALQASSAAFGKTGGAMSSAKEKSDNLSGAIRSIPTAKTVTVTFNTLGVQALKAAGEYLKNLKSKTVTGTIVINGQKINAGQFARGGTVYGPTNALIGEAGPEAVVPLNRPLSQVDPSVRWLSALAQGKTAFGAGGVAGGRQVVVQPGAIVVQTVRADPYLVATSVVDQLVTQVR